MTVKPWGIVAELEIPDAAWEECGSDEPWHVLLASAQINGTLFHAEALAVDPGDTTDEWDDQGVFEKEANLECAYEINGEAPLRTTTIRGREYVVTLVPFSA